ncbi:MAG: type II toxin-antitoxin system RelE/ParE family toxin [Akkermansiaceae bacterium]|nr:type II toxin-antitoxin system RelE/ParE family toxin [Akkermansiaceae bacterium]
MGWEYKISVAALKQLKKLGPEGARRILAYLDANIAGCENPRSFGKPLKGELGELWRYRTSHYRIICQLRDDELVVLAVRVGHRRDVYE